MASKKVKAGSNAVVYTLLVLGILVLVNLVASRLFARVDLTEDQIYTLSEASKHLVASLPDRLTVKAFISSDLPPHPHIRAASQYVRDLLNEYARASQGKMAWEVLDPAKSEKIQAEARRLKVLPTRLSVKEKTKVSVSQGYLGIAFQYGGKVEAIPFAVDINTLEYQISSTIRKLVGTRRKVGFTTGHGEPSLFQGLRGAKEALQEYEVTSVDLTEGKAPIPDDVDLLVMVSPRQRLAARALYEIDRFLMKGKSVAMFLDGTLLETPRGQLQPGQFRPQVARPNITGLRPMLKHYGVDLGQDIIMDQQNQRVVLPAAQGQRVVTNYPAFPIVTDLSRESPITRTLRSFIAVFPSSLQLTSAVQAKDSPVTATVLAKSSKASWQQQGFFLFDPMRKPVYKGDQKAGPFPLAVLLQGRFGSYFAGKQVPAPGPAAPPKEDEPPPAKQGPKSPEATRLVVVGDADFIKDQYLGVNKANLMLLLNTVDYLAEDETMIGIRSKTQTRRPLDGLGEQRVTLAKWLNIVGLPGLFVLFGFVRWRFHRRGRRRQAAALSEAVKRMRKQRETQQ